VLGLPPRLGLWGVSGGKLEASEARLDFSSLCGAECRKSGRRRESMCECVCEREAWMRSLGASLLLLGK
jgi:hypothetical protein